MRDNMRKFNIVIAEDNKDAREILRGFIRNLSDISIIGSANNGEELVDTIMRKKPDIVLVDIGMPKLNGMEAVKECIKIFPYLKFIFITGYDQFAVEAFSISAVDYILKPIEKNRLYLALEKAKKAVGDDKLSNDPEKNSDSKKLCVRFDRSMYFIPYQEVLFIEKIGRKSLIHTTKTVYETYKTLGNLERVLDHSFFQSHRSYIVNLEKIFKITASGETYLAYFSNYDKPAHVSKQKLHQLQHQLNNFYHHQ